VVTNLFGCRPSEEAEPPCYYWSDVTICLDLRRVFCVEHFKEYFRSLTLQAGAREKSEYPARPILCATVHIRHMILL